MRADAQSLAQGALSGVVQSADGKPISDAEVRITDRASGATRSMLTAREGKFHFGLLSPASYDVAVEALGFRPVVHVGVSILSGAAPAMRVVLRREAPPVVLIDTIRAAGSRAAPLSWLYDRGYAELVGGRRLASDAALLSPVADANGVEGLPWRHADLMVDGARVGAVGAPASSGDGMSALAVPLRSAAGITVGGMGYDVEAGGSGVGLNVLSLRGGGSPTSRSAVFGGTSDIGAAVVFGGPIQRDTSHAIAGVDYQRGEVAHPARVLASDLAGTQILTTARDTYGTDLAAYALETKRLEERLSGFGRLDWQLGDRYAVAFRAAGSRVVLADPPLLTGLSSGIGSRQEATAVQASVDVVARVSRRLTAELRVAGDASRATGEAPAVTPTTFATRGLVVGGELDEPFSDQRTTPRMNAMLHWDLGAHRLKVGGILASHRFETQGAIAGSGEFRFGDPQDFTTASGAWRGLGAVGGSGNFPMTERALFVQDAWNVADGLELTLGLRFDGNRVPVGEIEQNSAWLARSGLDNTAAQESRSRVAPRFGFRWELGSARDWVMTGGAGVYNDLPDRRDVAEALAFDRGVSVRSAVGALGGWPNAPDSVIAPVRGQTISLLGPGFEGPRTRRMSLGVQRDIREWTTYVQGVYRQTDFLARRRDLNLPVAASGRDQYRRPLYGTLRRSGSLLAAVPTTNRRFTDFDAVNAIEVTGFSEFWAATAGVERVVDAGVSFGLHYTFSKTTDNLAGGLDALAPLPSGIGGQEWSEGLSDLDVPHRVIAAAEWSLAASGAVRLGAVYRLQSGRTFTAGFREGVDANADGVWGNDPAYVDASLAGMNTLMETHACLRNAAGGFAERNSCRLDWTHRLDLRAAFRLTTFAAGPIDLVVDAMDVIPSMVGPIDRALLLVDRNGAMTTNPATGVTTVPFVVNSNFGQILSDRSPGMLFRVGLRIGR